MLPFLYILFNLAFNIAALNLLKTAGTCCFATVAYCTCLCLLPVPDMLLVPRQRLSCTLVHCFVFEHAQHCLEHQS